jgi:hypothetical protein
MQLGESNEWFLILHISLVSEIIALRDVEVMLMRLHLVVHTRTASILAQIREKPVTMARKEILSCAPKSRSAVFLAISGLCPSPISSLTSSEHPLSNSALSL